MASGSPLIRPAYSEREIAESIVETCRRAPPVRSSTVDRELTLSAPEQPGVIFASYLPVWAGYLGRESPRTSSRFWNVLKDRYDDHLWAKHKRHAQAAFRAP